MSCTKPFIRLLFRYLNLVPDRFHAVDSQGTSLQLRLGALFSLCANPHMAWISIDADQGSAVQARYRGRERIENESHGCVIATTFETRGNFGPGAVRTESARSQLQGEPHEPGHDPVDRSDPDADRRHSDLASQQELGLRAQWRVGLGCGRHRRAAAAGATLTCLSPSAFRLVSGALLD